MSFTEIAVAVITAGPAYIAVWLTARKAQGEPARPQACAQHAVCDQCEGRTPPGGMPGDVTVWALTA
ncbi:hypothetical protein GCM10009837_24560 [Streptomyces durmitorensis]